MQEAKDGFTIPLLFGFHLLVTRACYSKIYVNDVYTIMVLNLRGVRTVSRVFWLGIIGLFFGIIGAVIAIAVQSISEAFVATTSTNLYYNAAGAMIFSVVGMAGAVLEQRRIIGGLLMIIGSLGVLISISLFGVISFFFFVIGGILILIRKREEPVVTPPSEPVVTPPSTGQNMEQK